ncbi:MAG: DUF362 domain-containing protein [Clostridiales Family XIII bacterium]|jgi:uncharacterized protein (DUF362 family)|nr:DUF362 domain-containing protein [Clostridiales Family XIII bacterium]
MSKKAVVAIAKDPSVEVMVKQVFDELGGADTIIRKGSTVVLKPNAGHLGKDGTSVNTSPALVGEVIKAVKAAGARKVIVAESAAIGCDTIACLEDSGISDAARNAGVDEIRDIKSDKELIKVPIRDARSAITSVMLPRFLVEADHIINMPIFKSHASMVFTCALKNIKGVVQDKVHYDMHRTNLAMAMMDIWSVVRADLNIADLIWPAEGFGPHSPVPLDFGCVLASRDPVALDIVACHCVGLDTGKVSYFENARERGLGCADIDELEVRGKSIDEVYQKMWLPYLDGFDTWPEYEILPENSCSSCQSLVAFTMEKLKALDEYEKNSDAVIVLGAKKEVPDIEKERLILCGNCLRKHRDKGVAVNGCPPAEPHVAWAIIDRKDHMEIGPDLRDRMHSEEAPWNEYINALVAKKREERADGE